MKVRDGCGCTSAPVQMTLHRADVLEAYLNGQDIIQKATVYERTGDVVLTYRGSPEGR